MRPHAVYLVVDKPTGDVWPDWYYRRRDAREFVRRAKAKLGKNFTGRVVKYVPTQAGGDEP